MDLPDQLDAISVGKAHVGEAQMKFLSRQSLACLGQVLCLDSVDVHARQSDFQQFPDIEFVVDDQCDGLVHGKVLLARKFHRPTGNRPLFVA